MPFASLTEATTRAADENPRLENKLGRVHMKEKKSFGRSHFLKATGGALSLVTTVSSHRISSALADTAAGSPAIKQTPAQVKRLLDEMEARGPQYWSVPRKDGEFIHLLVKATHATRILELGTSHGFSAIWIGLALEENGGNLTTIEIDRERHELARRHIAEAGLSHRVNLIRADAHAEVPRLQGAFDFVFIDADKEGQVDYFNKLYPKKIIPGGMILVHNAIRQAGAMRDYLDMIRKHPDFDTVIVSATMDDGFCLSCRHRIS